ncbi:6517_t:CDS:2 [Entrophospora sp. SA101]|nr:6517_t:CDS:2 [Entrophospora sp. SA101]
MSQIRTELITPAVNFLKDPKVQSSPLQKRVAFLESKGLTSEEIEEALKQAKAGQIDWRDYFIAAVLIDQFTTTMEKLEVVKADAQLVKNTIDEQVVKVKGTLDNLDDVLRNLREKDDKRDVEIKRLKEYVNEIRDLVPKLFTQSKESQNQSLLEINQELKSLKSLILNRRTSQPIGSPIITSEHPSIPPWQLASNNSSNDNNM